MTNVQIAAIILSSYMIPGVLVAWITVDSKEFSETFDQMSASEQAIFVVVTTLFWPVVLLKAVSKALEMRRRGRK